MINWAGSKLPLLERILLGHGEDLKDLALGLAIDLDPLVEELVNADIISPNEVFLFKTNLEPSTSRYIRR